MTCFLKDDVLDAYISAKAVKMSVFCSVNVKKSPGATLAHPLA